MRKEYTEPVLEVEVLELKDVITTSDETVLPEDDLNPVNWP